MFTIVHILLLLVTILGFLTCYTSKQVHEDDSKDVNDLSLCNSKSQNCDSCLTLYDKCVWIQDQVFNSSRCTTANAAPHGVHLVSQITSNTTVIHDEDYRLPIDNTPAIQIRPQRLKLRFGSNNIATFQLRYKALANYPLDLYYLLDQTHTMRKHKEELEMLREELASVLRNLTTDYHIAFGYFSDRVAMPYQAISNKLLENPCRVLGSECVLGSNFLHALNFTPNINTFSEHVAHMNFTANMDDLESGFDAINQIIACQEKFGWRRHSRKIIILATDGYMHSAGDGILGGMVDRAPATCMMDNIEGRLVYDGMFYDYPSVEEIRNRLLDSKTLLLFAIQADDKGAYYKALNDRLHEVSHLSMLRNNAQAITNMVTDGYMNVVKKVQFNVKNQPDYLNFIPTAKCLKEVNSSWSCFNVELEKEYIFDVTVELNGPVPESRVDTLIIEEMHIHQQTILELEFPKTCECDPKDEEVPHGIYSCGIYKCDSGWIGPRCEKECDSNGRFKNDTYESLTCFMHGYFDGASCKCVCDSKYTGTYCEEQQCPRKNGLVCNGRGTCKDGDCICQGGFTGQLCDCIESNLTCIAPHHLQVCSGHGNCKCGQCDCNEKYSGMFCELCKECRNCLYDILVENHLLGKMNESNDYTINSVEDIDESPCILEYSPNSTSICTVNYKFEINDIVSIKYWMHCRSTEYNYYKASGSIVGLILGILFVPVAIWKIRDVIKSRRAWAEFEKAQLNSKYYSNNLYVSPVTTHVNPMADKNK